MNKKRQRGRTEEVLQTALRKSGVMNEYAGKQRKVVRRLKFFNGCYAKKIFANQQMGFIFVQ
jgi:hypothetical protein